VVDIRELVRKILRFRDARDWAQFHTPKSLAAALSVEVAELQELMLWKSDLQTLELVHSDKGSKRFEEEIADVLIYALLLAHEVGIDPGNAIRKKLIQNAAKYPISLAKGNAMKYSELRGEQASARQTEHLEDEGTETSAIAQSQIALFPDDLSRVN
jgi:NTP pyrophosphatase (non-canonical NTP hydrolase)